MHPELYTALASSFEEFRPSQEKAIKAGVLNGKNVLVCSPTASGKTVVAEMAGISKILNKNEKCIYIVPLKSLATEKRDEFKKKYGKLGVKVALSIGDLDSSDPWLENYDIIITTSEKLDSLIRHGARWLKEVGVVVIDEVHLLNDYGRGPTLEVLLTLLKLILPNAQLVALSATIGNPEELADWLDAELVKDTWRPVDLYQGIFHSDDIDFFEVKESEKVSAKISDPTLRLAVNTVEKGKQALIFCPTKNIAESTAAKLAALFTPTNEQRALSKKVLDHVTPPTKQCLQLAECVSSGVAFHHAGLVQKQKQLVEDSFRNDEIKIICCTPTLAMGVNLPAFRTIIKSLKRYSMKGGSDWIPVLEYMQMVGRAGRP